MTDEEPRYRMKKIVDGGVIKFRKLPVSLEDIIEERDKEISRLKNLVDELRIKIEQLEQEQQREQIMDKRVDSSSSYNIYK
jgi:hypothetical protein